MRALARLLVVVLSMVAGLARGETELWDSRTPEQWDRGVLVAEQAFHDEELIRICEGALKTGAIRFIRLVILTSEKQKFDLAPRSDQGFEAWARVRVRAATTPMQAAEMIAISGDAVLRIRDGRDVRHRIIAGNDPLQVRAGGSQFQILHISPTSSAFVVFSKTSTVLSLKDCRSFFDELQEMLGTRAIYLYVRNDVWFFADAFPAAYWFDIRTPPSRQTINDAPEVSCARYGPPYSVCTLSGRLGP